MDAHRRIFVQARQGIALPGVPFDPLDPFGIHHSKSTASESTTASSSSASVSASASSSITTSASASASVSASGPSSSAPASPSSPAPSPAPNTNSTPPPTLIATGPPSTETVFKTVGPTGSSAAPSTSTSPVTDTTQPTGFLQNKVLSGIVFGVVGLIGFTLVIFVATWMLRRRRNKRLVNEAISFDPVNLGKEDYPEDIIEKGRNSPTTGAGAAVGAVGAPTIGNSGHDARSMKSVGSYATGSASHDAPPVSQAPAFADYVPPVPYLNSAPSTPRTQQQFSEQQNQVHNIRGNSVYNPYLGSGYGQSPPPQQPPYAPPHYGQQPGPPAQPSIGYDYGNPVATEGEHARRSSSSMELQFASSGAGRK